jgi:hypothetical protein
VGTRFDRSFVETYELGFDEFLRLGTRQVQVRFRQKLVEALTLIFFRNSNRERFGLLFLSDGALTDNKIDGLYPSEGVKKLVSIVLGPIRMALFPDLWNAGHHRLGNVSSW